MPRFEKVAAELTGFDVERVWGAATERERRVLIVELVESVAVRSDHLELAVAGAPRLHVLSGRSGSPAEGWRCRRADPYSTPTLVLRTELALAG